MIVCYQLIYIYHIPKRHTYIQLLASTFLGIKIIKDVLHPLGYIARVLDQ